MDPIKFSMDAYDTSAHPWIRFWARVLDLYIFFTISLYGIFLLILRFILSYETYFFNRGTVLFFVIVASIILSVIMESILLSAFGTTPGKLILNIYVLDYDMKKLSLSDAMKRSIMLTVLGLGCYIPIIDIIAMLLSYFHLEKYGYTYWDEKSNSVLFHGHINGIRIVIYILVTILVKLIYTQY